MLKSEQANQMRSGAGFVAALDQSGGSTPKALRLYGVGEGDYGSEAEMFDLIHAMRARLVMSPGFTGARIVGAILFEMTMDRDIGGKPTATCLWEDRGVVPILKIDKGLEDAADGVRCMKPMGDLDGLLARATAAGIFGTKMRSVIDAASRPGIAANVAQQFDIGLRVLDHGLVPILEPEVTISITDKAQAEAILLDAITDQLDRLGAGQEVMLKLTLPEEANLYADLITDPRIMRVVALSGGYSRAEANARLARNAGIIASFSRALTEGLSAHQSDADFDALLDATIQSICDASMAG